MSNNLDFNVFVVVVLLEDCRQLRKESRGTPPLLLLSFFPPQRFVTFLSRGGRVLLSSVYSYYTCVWFSVIICRHFFCDALSRPDNLQTSSSLHSSNARVVELSKNIEMADGEKRKSLVGQAKIRVSYIP